MIQNIWKKLHLFTLFSTTRHCFSLFLVGSKSMLALLNGKSASMLLEPTKNKLKQWRVVEMARALACF